MVGAKINLHVYVLYIYIYILLFCCIDSSGKLIPTAVIAYKFDKVAEHPVLINPRGNLKKNKPY